MERGLWSIAQLSVRKRAPTSINYPGKWDSWMIWLPTQGVWIETHPTEHRRRSLSNNLNSLGHRRGNKHGNTTCSNLVPKVAPDVLKAQDTNSARKGREGREGKGWTRTHSEAEPRAGLAAWTVAS